MQPGVDDYPIKPSPERALYYFPAFNGWSEGYGSFTCSYMDMGRLIDYVKHQQEHHRKKSFEEEYRSLLLESGLEIDERYFP